MHYVAIDRVGTLKQSLCDTFLDSLLFSLPWFFFNGKWRNGLIYIALPILALLFEINALYYRNFHALPGLAMLTSGEPFNKFVLIGALDSLQWRDLLMTVVPVGVLIVSWKLLKGKNIKSEVFGRWVIIAVVIVWLMAPVMRCFTSIRRAYIWSGAYSFTSLHDFSAEVIDIIRDSNDHIYSLTLGGFLPCFYTVVNSAISSTLELSEDDCNEIVAFLDSRSNPLPVAGNRGKNFVLIVVESLNSTTINTPATPFLSELVASEGTLSTLNLREQVGVGRSADGQFMYNVGLLPLRNEVLAFKYGTCDYPSLAKVLRGDGGYYSIEVICEDSSVWNHRHTTAAYGFDRLISGVGEAAIDNDARVFARAAEILDSLPRPFFMQITTIDMHEPYKDAAVSTPGPKHADLHTANYLAATLACDTQIREFFNELNSRGMLANTIVAIVGDHCARQGALSPEFTSQFVPLIVANAGITKSITDEAEQIDVYPTLLDLLGLSQRYRGVGQSLLSDSIKGTDAKAWEVSEQIIRSRVTCPAK